MYIVYNESLELLLFTLRGATGDCYKNH